jgi:septation ring formation regulator EzrA
MLNNLNNLKDFNSFEFVSESTVFPVSKNPIQEKITQIKETWNRIRKNKSLLASINLDEDRWQLEEGEDLSSHWFNSTIKECLCDYKKMRKSIPVQEQTISDLESFHERLLSIEQNLKDIRNKV